MAGRVTVGEAAQTMPFWLLMGTFFVCGYTSVGMIGTHFIPHALEHNFTAMQASAALGVMGAMNIVGTVGSGWLCDRVGRSGSAGHLLLRPGLVANLSALRLERPLTPLLGRHLRPELHLDGAADHDADRQHLRPLLGRRAQRLDLLRPPGRRRHRAPRSRGGSTRPPAPTARRSCLPR